MSSMSTQLLRGTIAFPMLLMFAGFGVVAARGVQAECDSHAAVDAAKVQIMARLCEARESSRQTLVLAHAPADLGNLVLRFNPPCRA